MKNSLNAILCLCLLSLLCISPGRAQQEQPQTPPAQPAAAQAQRQPRRRRPSHPMKRRRPSSGRTSSRLRRHCPSTRMSRCPGRPATLRESSAGCHSARPIVNKGHAADFSGLSYFHLPGTPKITPSAEIGLALGLHNSLDLSYFSTKASGSVTAPGALVLFSQSYNKGDLLATSDKVQDVKLSFAYLTWPYPVESRHFRLRTLWQVHYLTVSSNYDAPVRSATPDSSGNLTSYATTGAKNIHFAGGGPRADRVRVPQLPARAECRGL